MKAIQFSEISLSLLVAVTCFNLIVGVFSVQKVNELESQLALVSGESRHVGALASVDARDEVVTQAVARLSPSVVSIIISRNIPDYHVEYENPFDNNSILKKLNLKIPIYKNNGSVKEEVGGGTGFIVSKDGLVVTNKHVVDDANAEYTVILNNNQKKIGKVVYKDPTQDIAVLKIEGTYNSVGLGDSSSLKVGQSVIAIGNALGEYNNSVSVGIVSGLDRSIKATDGYGEAEDLNNVIQTDAAINRGNSGGPLVDLEGKVIGVNVATVVGSSNISFAIPINAVKQILKNMFSI